MCCFQAQMTEGARSPIRQIYFRTFETASSPIAVAAVAVGLRRKFMQAIGLQDPEVEEPDSAPKSHYERLQQEVEGVIGA